MSFMHFSGPSFRILKVAILLAHYTFECRFSKRIHTFEHRDTMSVSDEELPFQTLLTVVYRPLSETTLETLTNGRTTIRAAVTRFLL